MDSPPELTSKPHSHPGVSWNGPAGRLCWPLMTVVLMAVLTHLSQPEPLLGRHKKQHGVHSVRTLREFLEPAVKPLIDRLVKIKWNKISKNLKSFLFTSLLFKTCHLIKSSTK